jgi:hypothetical protein
MPPNQKPQEPIDVSLHNEPKQYIRTLERDTAALKQGTKPDFAVVEQQPEPPTTAPPLPPPKPLPPPPPPSPQIKEEHLIEPARTRLIEGSVFPAFSFKKAPEVPVPPTPIPVPPDKAPLHTYTSDFSERLKTTQASTATVLAAEGDTRAQRAVSPARFNIPFIAGGILLIILGTGGAYATYQYVTSPAPIQIAPAIATPIFINEREEVSGVGGALTSAISASLKKTLSAGSVRLLYIAAGTTTSSDVFHALQLPAPGILLRNVNTPGSMAGIVSADGTASPFFILSVSSYGDTFAGMLAWEPHMNADLSLLFPLSGTTTLAFRDEIISNHDVRVLRDANGQSLLMYGYWDPKALIIARNESAYSELLKRFATSRTAH